MARKAKGKRSINRYFADVLNTTCTWAQTMSNSGFGAGRGIGRGVGRGGFPVFTASGGTGLPAYVQHSAVQRAAPPAPTAQSSWIKIATGRGAGGSSEHGPGQVSATPAQQRRRLKSAEVSAICIADLAIQCFA